MASWRRLDEAGAGEARALLGRCCGSRRWVEHMLARRPFAGQTALVAAARDEWFALGPDDWREAFAHHPRIGDRHAAAERFAPTRDLSRGEQAGVGDASAAVLDALAEGNRAYEARFGYTFIVCATGKTAEDMLALLQSRLENDPVTELQIASTEQAKITAIRLAAL
ncbi:MAG: 2-oxo-4-hydroxy-4-carboxy-5-ureidoimidazoline decarboxylase [Acidobacteriota bacterium]